MGTVEIRYDEDDGDVLDLGVEHAFSFVRDRSCFGSRRCSIVFVRWSSGSDSEKMSPWCRVSPWLKCAEHEESTGELRGR